MESKQHIRDYEIKSQSNSAGASILNIVESGKRVLEIGAGAGALAKLLTEERNCQVTALEIDKSAIPILKTRCAKVVEADLNNLHWHHHLLASEGRFDVIVAADILEHLDDPWATLERMKTLLEPGGYVVSSIPHAGHNGVVACLLCGDFSYSDRGLLDRTHIRFFGLKNIDDLFDGAGFNVVSKQYVLRPARRTHLAAQWRKLPWYWRFLLTKRPAGKIYHVVIKAFPR